MGYMNSTIGVTKRKQGHQLRNAERTVLISKLVDALCQGYQSTNSLAVLLKVDRSTIEAYRPLADELIGKMKLDRNVIRNLEVQKIYRLTEKLIKSLETETDKKYIMLTHDKIAKYTSLLASITGIGQEFSNVDNKGSKLIIVRGKDVSTPVEAEVVPTQQR